jgi:hypothetical protein
MSSQYRESPWQVQKSWSSSHQAFSLTVQVPSFGNPPDLEKMEDDNISGFLDAGYTDMSPFNQLQSSLDSPRAMVLEAPRRARTLPGLMPVQIPSPIGTKMEDLSFEMNQQQVQPMQALLERQKQQLELQLLFVQQQLQRQRHMASPLSPGHNFPAQPSGFASSLDSPSSDAEMGDELRQNFTRVQIPSFISLQSAPVQNTSAPSTPRDWFRNSPTAYA